VNGRVLPQSALPGIVLTLGDGPQRRRIRIDAVEPDPKVPLADPETLARFIHRAPEAVVLQRGVGAVFGGVGETLR
jgi:hypothetical protein